MPRCTRVTRSGRGRGRGRGRGQSLSHDTSASTSSGASAIVSTSGSASTSAGESADQHGASSSHRTLPEVEAVMANQTKALVAKMSPDAQRSYRDAIQRKQLERSLLPDAPPRKRNRKISPERVPCRLVAGTPETSPQPIPQLWQQPIVMEDGAELTVAMEVTMLSEASSASSLECDWTTGDLTQDELLTVSTTIVAPTPAPRRRPPSSVSEHEMLAVPSTSMAAPQEVPTPRRRQPSKVLYYEQLAVPSTSWVPTPTPRRRSPSSVVKYEVLAVPSTSSAPSQETPAPRQIPPPAILQSNEQVSGSADYSEADEDCVNKWLLDHSSGDEEEELVMKLEEQDFANEAPAHTDDIDPTLQDWLTHEDEDADRLMRNLLPTDNTFDWDHNADSFLGQREEFRGQSGPTFSVPADARPIDIFYRFFDREIFELLVTETNRHFNYMTRPLQQHSRLHRATRTTRDEMVVFIAVLIFQGIIPLPVEKDYWRYNGYLTLPYFRQLMSYNRFLLLKRMLHFTDDSAQTQIHDLKLRKLGPLLNLLNSRFSELYLPSRDIAIDESLLKWHGRLSFAQRIVTKSAKVGIKSYELCESSTGYLWKFFIYTGKGTTDETTRQDEDSEGLDGQAPPKATVKIVLDLVRPLLNRGHTLTMDNFYNSPLLARFLKKNGTDCLGTLRVNREHVPESIKGMSKADLRPGEIVQSYCRDMSVLLWRDNNIVALLSTFHGGQIGGREKHGHYRYKPQAVLDYNKAMGGVDKKDQLLSSHPIERTRNHAWYKKAFRRLLNATVLNAYIIYKRSHPTMTQRDFRFRLANEMVESVRPPVGPLTSTVETLRVIESARRRRSILVGNHYVGMLPKKFTRCVWCKKSRTVYKCEACSVALCINICFKEYHTMESRTNSGKTDNSSKPST